MRVSRAIAVLLAVTVVCFAPEGASAKEKQPKVSELLKEANELMTQAQASYVDGQSKQAIEQYRKALAEIQRVERENPRQASTAEFAPVRFRRALCETEIDRIMLEDVNAAARTVAVTDTTALEAKREERRKAAATNNVPEAAVKLAAKQGAAREGAEPAADEPDEPAAAADPAAPVDTAEELEWAKDMLSVDRFGEAEQALLKVLKQQPEHREGRLLLAMARVRQGRAADAAVILDDLLSDYPADEAALLLAAGAQVTAGSYGKAMETLDRALKANPKRPAGYLNMAWLLLEMNPKDTAEAELYYRQSVKLGGPRDRDIERRLGIRPE